jgi:hypothetical protein
MSRAPSRILESLAVVLNRLPGVFSTAQWGGRAYKLPGPGGSLKKPKLLAFVSLSRDGASVVLTFKLPKPRAVETIGRHSWIIKESFGSLGAAGWVQAKLTQQRQINVLTGLLAESRALYPVSHAETAVRAEDDAGGAKAGSSAVARRIARVMQQELPEGWSPPQDRDFAEHDARPVRKRRATASIRNRR